MTLILIYILLARSNKSIPYLGSKVIEYSVKSIGCSIVLYNEFGSSKSSKFSNSTEFILCIFSINDFEGTKVIPENSSLCNLG